MPRTPNITPNRALHLLFDVINRARGTVTSISFLNNGGRSKLMPMGDADIPMVESPVMNKQICDNIIDAAHTAARAIYGPRSKWPVQLTFEAPTTRLTADDAADHLGDHVIGDRIYTFNIHAANVAHDVMNRRLLVRLGSDVAYKESLSALRFLLRLDPAMPDYRVFLLARSYTRRHPKASTA